MRIIFSIVFLLLATFTAFAQKDSLFVELKGDKWVIPHETELGENLFILAKRYHVPPAVLADENGLNYKDGIDKGGIIHIPFTKYNQAGAQPFDIHAVKEVYYTVGTDENLFTLSKYAGVPQHIMQQWNKMTDNTIVEGQILFAGWVLYDSSHAPFSDKKGEQIVGNGKTTTSDTQLNKDSVIIIKMPKKVIDTLSDIEEEYMTQTGNEENVTEEKGTVAFFNSAGKVKSSDVYYAFHNGTAKGTVIKVYNPGTDKTILVKVLGPLPSTKQYYNAIMGLGSVARDMLGVTESKAWCELKFAMP